MWYAANYVAIVKLLMEKHYNLLYTPFVAHCIDVMFEDLSKLLQIKNCVEHGMNICKFTYQHTWILHLEKIS